MFKAFKLHHWLLLILVPAASLFFIGGPAELTLPWQRYAWNLGHIAFFFLVTLAIHSFKPLRSTGHVFIYMAALAVASLILETIQSQFGRSMSTMDVLRNLVGAGLALFLVSRAYLHLTLQGFLGFILTLDLIGFSISAWTDYSIQSRAPIVENFESTLTLSYWSGDVQLVEQPVKAGHSALQVTMTPGAATRAEFNTMLRDWTDYNLLSVAIFNPDTEQLTLTLRINDEHHERRRQRYSDRFNKTFVINQGWNTVEFNLDDVKNAPTNRLMDMTVLSRLIIFSSGLTTTRTIYIDELVLR